MELTMSSKERDRLKVLHALSSQPNAARRLTQAQAAQMLGLSVRQVRRLVRRYQKEGDAGLIHRSRGRPSNRKFDQSFKEQVIGRVRECYRDFGPTLAAEKLAERDGLILSREALRKWMIQEGLWKPKPRKLKHRQWRERKACFGELVQMDASQHDWLEGRGPKAVLITMIDDATSRPFMRFYPTESTETTMRLLRDYIGRFGRPVAIYADKASHFLTTRQATVDEQLQGLEAETQIQRALRELDIGYIPAHSPQAKGRVERCFGTAQDRLIKELRLAGIDSIQAANDFIEEHYVPMCIECFTVAPQTDLNAHRSAQGFDLDAVVCPHHTRTVTNDYTIQFQRSRYQIAPESVMAGLRGAKVIVEQRLDGQIQVRFKERYLQISALPQQPAKAHANHTASARKSAKSKRTSRAPYKPPADHPWRRSYKRMGRYSARL